MLGMRQIIFAAMAGLSLGGSALAQTAPPARVRGEIDMIDANQIRVRTKAGEVVTLKLTPETSVTWIAPIAIEAIKPGSFIGTAAMPQPDGTLQAREVQVFPEAMRGIGEGHRPWDLEPGGTMTNGTVGDLAVSKGRLLTLVYKGGEQKVYVPENAPVITYLPATQADLKQGAHVIVFAAHNPDETLTATRIGEGKDGLIPPM